MSISDLLKSLYDNLVLAVTTCNEFTEALPDCYDAVDAKGGTLPQEQTAGNLADAIESIPSPSGDRIAPTRIYFASSNVGSLSVLSLKNITTFNSMFYGSGYVGEVDFTDSEIRDTSYDFTTFCIASNSITKFIFPALTISNGTYAFSQNNALSYLDLRLVKIGSSVSVASMFFRANALTSIRVGDGWLRGVDLKETGLQHDGIVQFFNDLPTISDSQTITLGSTKLGYLSEAEKAIATDKGWTLA